MGLASLGGVAFRIDPDSVAWEFRMKTARRKTVGGVVVQVYGTDLGDMTVSGVFGNGDRARGDREGWREQERFRAQVERWVDQHVATSGRPIRFLYPPKRWDFQVLIRGYTGPGGGEAVAHDPATFNPGWTLTLAVVQDSTRRVVAGIQDLYIKRLMAGVGWKQSGYNGPLTQGEAEAVLAPFGGSLHTYLAEQFNQAAGFSGGDVPLTPTGEVGAASGSVDDWISQAGQALGRTFTAAERAGLKIIIQHESSGNPRARNDTAAGRAAGGPKGLMQTVDGTFAANKLPGYGDVFNPVHNIVAAVRYIDGRYGSIANVPGVKSVRAGQRYRPY
jgi:hypothetical protein